jgi:Tfp pilus assembly major pilin PilA
MLKTYRIIPLVFILFLFGFTFITVSLVSADERDAFVQCQQMPTQPNNFKSLKRQKNCFRDVAKRLGAKKREGAFGACQRVSTQKMQQKIDCFMDVASSLMPNTAPPAGATGMPPTMAAPPAAPPAQAVVPVESSGGEVAELNVTIAALQSQVATLSGQHVELQSQVATLTTTNAQLQEPLNAKIAELNAENARLLAMQNAPSAPSGGEVAQLNARIDELKGDLKFEYRDHIVARCKVNLLKERLVKWADTNPFHGQDNALLLCRNENDGIKDVGAYKDYSYYFGRK